MTGVKKRKGRQLRQNWCRSCKQRVTWPVRLRRPYLAGGVTLPVCDSCWGEAMGLFKADRLAYLGWLDRVVGPQGGMRPVSPEQ